MGDDSPVCVRRTPEPKRTSVGNHGRAETPGIKRGPMRTLSTVYKVDGRGDRDTFPMKIMKITNGILNVPRLQAADSP
jgi:hypothetical protein